MRDMGGGWGQILSILALRILWDAPYKAVVSTCSGDGFKLLSYQDIYNWLN